MPSLQESIRIPISHPSLLASLRRLSREALVELVQMWAHPDSKPFCHPTLDPESAEGGSSFGPAPSLTRVQEIYRTLLKEKANKKEILERFLEVDWRHGLALLQLAEVDARNLQDRPSSLRWSALILSAVKLDHEKPCSDHAAPMPDAGTGLKQRGFAEGLNRALGTILSVHVHGVELQATGLQIYRVVIASDDSSVDNGILTDVDGSDVSLRIVWLAFRESAAEVYVSPPSVADEVGRPTAEGILLRAVSDAAATPATRFSLKDCDQDPMPLLELDDGMRKHVGRQLTIAQTWRQGSAPLSFAT